MAKESNATSEIESTMAEKKTKVHMAYSRQAHMFVASYHMSQLRYQFISRDQS